MELVDAINKRRSIRRFINKEVEAELVEEVLKCGILAPSSKNKQPWNFLVLKGGVKDNVANFMIQYIDRHNKQLNINKSRFNSIRETARVIKEAPILIVIFRKKDRNCIIGDNLSIGACVENMCLRAVDLGLGSLWIRDIVYVSKEISNMINNSEFELNCALSLGYADEFPKARPRKNLKDIVIWYDDSEI